MALQLIIILVSVALSVYFYIKQKSLYSGIMLLVLIISAFLLLVFNQYDMSKILYWLSLTLVFLYPFAINRKERKYLIVLYVVPLIIDELFRLQHYPRSLLIDALFFVPFILYIVMGVQYSKYKSEYSFLTLITGLNLITLLKTLNVL